MGLDRDRLLATIRAAVAAGNRAGSPPSLPERAGIGYQGTGGDLVGRFAAELTAAGGICHVVANREAAVAATLDIVRNKAARRALLGNEPVIGELMLRTRLRECGVEVSDPVADRQTLFAADTGVSGVDFLVAETGSIALLTAPNRPRSLSLLPPVHIAIASRSQLLPDLFDLFAGQGGITATDLSACLTLITGPSKTGDIELKLVTGVHGPGELHVVLVDPGH